MLRRPKWANVAVAVALSLSSSRASSEPAFRAGFELQLGAVGVMERQTWAFTLAPALRLGAQLTDVVGLVYENSPALAFVPLGGVVDRNAVLLLLALGEHAELGLGPSADLVYLGRPVTIAPGARARLAFRTSEETSIVFAGHASFSSDLGPVLLFTGGFGADWVPSPGATTE